MTGVAGSNHHLFHLLVQWVATPLCGKSAVLGNVRAQIRNVLVQTRYVRAQTRYVRVQIRYVRVQTRYVWVQTRYVRVQTRYVRVQTRYVRVQTRKFTESRKLTKYSVNGNYDILVTHILKFGNSSGMNSQW